jgi:hypothetical protein
MKSERVSIFKNMVVFNLKMQYNCGVLMELHSAHFQGGKFTP